MQGCGLAVGAPARCFAAETRPRSEADSSCSRTISCSWCETVCAAALRSRSSSSKRTSQERTEVSRAEESNSGPVGVPHNDRTYDDRTIYYPVCCFLVS